MVRKVINVICTIVLIALIAIVVLLFAARLSGKAPSLFGYHVFRVASDSMTPTLQVGDVILVHEVQPEEIQEGDIVSFKGSESQFNGAVITHRVVAKPQKSGDVYFYQTQGDKEGASLDPPITYSQLEGKYVRTLPLLSKLYSFFLSPYGIITFVFLIVALFGYEIISLILSYKSIDEHDEDYYAPPNRKPKHKKKKS